MAMRNRGCTTLPARAVCSNTPIRVGRNCSSSRSWLLTIALVCMAVSLQVGLSRADNLGSCVNQACAPGLCCSANKQCGLSADYCGLGCLGGSCMGVFTDTPGSCVNRACGGGLCCNSNYLCGSASSDCGVGCLGGNCGRYSAAAPALSSNANAGLALAFTVLGTITVIAAS